MKRLILTFAILQLITWAAPEGALAQGYITCHYDSGECKTHLVRCESGYHAPTEEDSCGQYDHDPSGCEYMSFDCELGSGPTPTPGGASPTPTPGGGGGATCNWPFGTTNYEGVYTGLGCIPTEPEGLVNWFLYYATRIAGGIAFALLLYGGILFITAQGDEDKVEEAQKTITSALTGLLVIIFATLILKVIGYDILGIPGWGPGGGLTTPGSP